MNLAYLLCLSPLHSIDSITFNPPREGDKYTKINISKRHPLNIFNSSPFSSSQFIDSFNNLNLFTQIEQREGWVLLDQYVSKSFSIRHNISE